MVCFCAIISFLNAFIWNVEVTGNSRVSTSAVTAYLENNNLKKGVMWGGVNRNRLSWDMMSEFDDFSWVHINKIGTTASVEINETTPSPNNADNEKLKGLDVFRRELTVTVNRQQNEILPKKTNKYYTLHFFSLNLPLYFKKEPGEQSAQSSKFIEIHNVTLPVGYTKYEERFFSTRSKTLSDEQLTSLAKKE